MKVYDPIALGLTIGNRNGNEVQVICPFHDDHHPSASFNVAKGLFVCYRGCKPRNVEQLAEYFGSTISLINDYEFVSDNTETKDWKSICSAPLAFDNEYLIWRGVKNEIVKDFEIRKTLNGIAVVIKNHNGDIVGIQERRQQLYPRYIVHGSKTVLWPIDRFDIKTPSIIVEGIFGVFNLLQYGVNAFAALGVSSASSIGNFLIGVYHTAFFDSDDAGFKASKICIAKSRSMDAIIPGGEADEISEKEWQSISKQQRARTLKEADELHRIAKSALFTRKS